MKNGKLSNKYKEALDFTFELHQNQTRKGVDIPYMTHLMSVSSLILENGGDEEQAIAGLLHDSIEDQSQNFGGADKLRMELERRFGKRVLDMVEACTDADTIPKPPWRARKEQYIASIAHKSQDALLVSLADKCHNSKTILNDYKILGDAVFDRFTAKKDGTLWYYRSLATEFSKTINSPLVADLDATVTELERLSTVFS